MFKEKLGIIIPTKDRPDRLNALLESISTQSIKPVQVIVVDGGDTPVKNLLEKFSELHLKYVRSTPPSLTAQRNAGIRAVCDEATLVAFLDDDIILEGDALKNMMKFWETVSEDVAGAAFNLTNELYKRPSFIEKIFLVNAEKPSRILCSGFQSKVSFQKETVSVDWLVGCVMTWRKIIFNEFMFDEWFRGYARYEDVDFSYRIGKKYKMFIVANAKVKHFNKLENIKFSFSLGKMQVINRLYFAKKNPSLSVPLCYWACFGLFINNIIKGLLHFDQRYILRCKGNIVGIFSCILPSQILK